LKSDDVSDCSLPNKILGCAPASYCYFLLTYKTKLCRVNTIAHFNVKLKLYEKFKWIFKVILNAKRQAADIITQNLEKSLQFGECFSLSGHFMLKSLNERKLSKIHDF